jgi:hypothetical protein
MKPRCLPNLNLHKEDVMIRPKVLLALFALALAVATGAAAAEVKSAKGGIELSDPAGDVNPITTSGGSYPGFDVVKLSIKSDGQKITIGATLKDPPPDFASTVLVIYFDTDANKKTGAKLSSFKGFSGYDYMAELQACIEYDNGMKACSGGSSKAKPVARFAAINMVRYPGESENKKEKLVSSLGFPGRKPSAITPIKGKVVQTTLEYADLKVKSGQTIGILVHEACSFRKPENLFPEIRLTLK